MPRVSVIVTCHNFERYLEACLDSIARQTFGDVEAVVVDNNSTDRSRDVAQAFAARDTRLQLIHEPRQGVHHALEAGITAARGELLLLLDGDDVYEPTRVGRTIACFDATQAEVVACNGQRIDADGRREEPFESYDHSAELFPAVACQYNPVWTVSFLAFRAPVLKGWCPLPACCSRILDWHFLLSTFEDGRRLALLDEPLVLKRYHGRNLAFDVEATELQAIPRLAAFMARYAPVRDVYGARDRSRLLTTRYIRAFEAMRRAGRWASIPNYLIDHAGADGIREDVQRFARAVAWYHLDRQAFVREARSRDSAHPLWQFVGGLAAIELGDAAGAARSFELAYVRPLRRFAEAMNSWGVAMARVDAPRSVRVLEELVRRCPDYRDARLNLEFVRRGRYADCRHTVCLRPETLHALADVP